MSTEEIRKINPERMLRLYDSESLDKSPCFVSLDWPILLENIAGRCHSAQSAEVARCLPLHNDEALCARRLAEISELLSLYEFAEGAPSILVQDCDDAISRAQRGATLEPEELMAVAKNLDVYIAVIRAFNQYKEHCPLLFQYIDGMEDFRALERRITAVFAPDGSIVDKASPDLASLREKARRLSESLRKRIEAKLADPDILSFLQDGFYTQREGRYVLPVKTQKRSKLSGIVHATSASGQTVFVEPADLVESNNALRMADFAINAEEARILQNLSIQVGQNLEAIRACHRRCIYLDLLDAVVQFANECNAHVPSISKSEIALHNAKHPLLALREKSEPKFRAVANHIYLKEPQTALIISGANAGGKTVNLKTLGLFALMSKAGIPLTCGPDSRIPHFPQIFSDIGDEQSLANDTSTFSARIIALRQAMAAIKGKALFLLDEPFSGTDPEHASALVIAMIEALHQRGVTQCLTTHFDAVKAFTLQNDYTLAASVGFDIDLMQATYKLRLGVAGASSAFEIAQKHGLAQDIINTASAIYAQSTHSELEQVIARLEKEREALDVERETLAEKMLDLKAQIEENNNLREKMRKSEASVLGFDVQRASEQLAKIRSRIKSIKASSYKKSLYRDAAAISELEQDLKTAQEEIDDSAKRVRAITAPRVDDIPVEDIKIGAQVYSRSYQRTGALVEINDERATLQMGAFKVYVKLDDLGVAPQEVDPQPKEKSRKKRYVAAPVLGQVVNSGFIDEVTGFKSEPQNSENTLDLRGMAADDALERCSWFIESLSLEEHPVAYIIHGHGTGVLKQELRFYLSRAREVAATRPGNHYEGGDGVTLAFLKNSPMNAKAAKK